jgi:hypothetical protein
VSAWANLPEGVIGDRVVVAQVGSLMSGLSLGYSGSYDGKWHFSYGDVDGTQGTGTYVPSIDLAVKGDWVHLVGVYDAAAGQIRFYVNGDLQGSSTVTNPWHAAGAVEVGRSRWWGFLINHWSGSIDQVRLFAGAMSDREVQNLHNS